MPLLEHVVALAEPWAAFYADTPVLQTATAFAHFGGLLLGGGFAIAADAATIRASRSAVGHRRRQLAYIHGVHRVVLVGLAATLLSGVLMFAADLETLATAPVFWVKMAIVALLLGNGGMMAMTESSLRARTAEPQRGWRRMHAAATCSLALWFAAVLAGTMLVNPGT